MASGVAPFQVPIVNDREYEEALAAPPLGFVLKTAILPRGHEEWNSRRQNVVDKFLELGVNITRHNEFVTMITGYFRDILPAGKDTKWDLHADLGQKKGLMCGPIEAMDMWLLEQPGSTYFLPTDF